MKRLFLLLLIPFPAFAAAVTLSIPKIDPAPLVANAHFSVVVQIGNSTTAVAHVALSVTTDTSARAIAVVPPNGTTVEVLDGVFPSPGAHNVGADAYTAVLSNGVYVFPSFPSARPLTAATQSVNVASVSPTFPLSVYVGPDGIEGDNQVWSSGVIQRVVGDDQTLFAVSKTAGIWRYTMRHASWVKLQSPPKAFSIVRDPSNPARLVVGERSDDASDQALGFSGLWQSLDSGESWNFLYDPLNQTSSQAIPAVAISPKTGTLFLATAAGVGRWTAPQNAATVENIVYPPTAAGNITAIAVDSSRIWARTTSVIMHSEDDGLNWEADTLPSPVVLPEVGTLPAAFDEWGKAGGNDRNSLAAFEDEAFLVFQPDTSSLSGKLKTKYGNLSPLLIYRPDARPADKWVAQWTRDGDGRGLGGTRFVRAYHLPCSTLDDTIGKRRQVFFGAGQGIQQADSESNGTLNFGSPIDAGDVNVHSDWWDAQFEVNGCQIEHQPFWVANDGGVFRTELGGNGHLSTSGWKYQGLGLHTHNINGMVAVPRINGDPPFLAYAATDNSGWYRDNRAKWHAEGFMGDANSTAADGLSPLALIWRVLWGNGHNEGVITGFGSSFSGSNGNSTKQFELYNNTDNPNLPMDGPTRVQPIQPGLLESVESGALDVALLIRAPLLDEKGHPISGRDAINNVWPQPNPPKPTIIRNPQFAHHPSSSKDKFKDWYIVSDDLPDGATRFWPTNGLANTRYYIEVNTPRCPSNLWVIQGIDNRCAGSDYQLPLIAEDSSGISPPYGPVFVDPLEQNLLIALFTKNQQMQIGYSRDGGDTMCSDATLTALLTQSNRLPFLAAGPQDTLGGVGSTYHGRRMQLIPTSVAFDRDDPTRVVVASPYGVVVTAQINTDVRGGVCQQPNWVDLSASVQNITAYISTVQIANHILFVATEGEGLNQVSDFTDGLPAAWIEPHPNGTATSSIAVLHNSVGVALPFSRATIQLEPIEPCALTAPTILNVRSDATGNLFPTSPIPACSYAANVAIANDGSHASAVTKFRYTVQ